MLARRPGWVFTRYQIVDAVRGEDAEVTERSVDVHVAAIRRKLDSIAISSKRYAAWAIAFELHSVIGENLTASSHNANVRELQ